MEYIDSGDLEQKIYSYQSNTRYFPEFEVWNIFIQMLRGLSALHEKDIMHRDIKTANIFLNKDKTIKIGDMNVSKVIQNDLLSTQTGTP